MLLTVTNLSSTDPVDVPYPFNITLAASGAKQLGVGLDDFTEGDFKGKPAYKELNLMSQKGQISLAIAANATDSSILETANRI